MNQQREVVSLYERVRRSPKSAPAIVVSSSSSISYGDLFRRVDVVAEKISCLQNHVIGVCLEGVDLAVVYLAILKVGAVFCPLESGLLMETKLDMLQTVNAVLFIHNQTSSTSFTTVLSCTVEGLQNLCLKSTIDNPPANKLVPSSAIHVSFTSGTTSGYKVAVCDGFGSINSHLYRNERVPWEVSDVCGCNIFGIWDMMATFLAGFPVVMLTRDVIQDPLLLASCIDDFKISRIMLTPSLLSKCLMFDEFLVVLRKQLRVVTLCGEMSSLNLIETTLREMKSSGTVVNLYSLTECHDVALRIFDKTTRVAPTGMDIFPNVGIVTLDDAKKVTTEWGLVHVYGPTLCLECDEFVDWFDPQGQAHRLFNTKDVGRLRGGKLELLGRACDVDEVNVNGYKLSLNYIEDKILECSKGTTTCCLLPMNFGDIHNDKVFTHLVACVVNGDGDTIRAKLIGLLPTYAIPSHFFNFSTLPVKHTGKVDKTKLAEMILEKTCFDSSSSSRRFMGFSPESVVAIFSECVGQGNISKDDDFFELGGTSLGLLNLLHCISKSFNVTLSVAEVIENKLVTPRRMFERVSAGVLTKVDVEEEVDVLVELEQFRKNISTSYGDTAVPGIVKSALVTGGTGFVGSCLVTQLIGVLDFMVIMVRDRRIRDVVDYANHVRERYDINLVLANIKCELRIFHGNIVEPSSWPSYHVDCVFHLAARIDMLASYSSLKTPNIQGVVNAINFAQAFGGKKLFYMSTSSVLPSVGTKGCSCLSWEEARLDLTTADSTNTSGLYRGTFEGYVQSKWVAEQLVWHGFENHDIRGVVFRAAAIAPPSGVKPSRKLFSTAHSMLLIEAYCLSILRLRMLPAADDGVIVYGRVDQLCKKMTRCLDTGGTDVVHLLEGKCTVTELSSQFDENMVSFETWRKAFQELVEGDDRWKVIFQADHGIEGLFGMCEKPIQNQEKLPRPGVLLAGIIREHMEVFGSAIVAC